MAERPDVRGRPATGQPGPAPNPLTAPAGPFPVWVWALAAGVGFYLWRRHQAATAPTPPDMATPFYPPGSPPPVGDDGTDPTAVTDTLGFAPAGVGTSPSGYVSTTGPAPAPTSIAPPVDHVVAAGLQPWASSRASWNGTPGPSTAPPGVSFTQGQPAQLPAGMSTVLQSGSPPGASVVAGRVAASGFPNTVAVY